jgi:hypothetical protein
MTDDGFCTALRLSPSTAANCAMGEILWSVAKSLLEDILDRLGAHFSRLVVKGFTVGIQH